MTADDNATTGSQNENNTGNPCANHGHYTLDDFKRDIMDRGVTEEQLDRARKQVDEYIANWKALHPDE